MKTDSSVPIDPVADTSPPTGLALALLMIAAATVAGRYLDSRWGIGSVALLYILPVLAAARYGGLWPALLAAVTSALAYNFWFTAPYRTFLIHNPADVVTFVVLLVVALVTSRLAGGLREQARLAAAHAARNATIAGFARRLLASATEQAIADVAVAELSRLFACHAVLLKADDPPQVIASSHPDARLAPSDHAAAAATFSTGEPAGRGVTRVDIADWQFRPIGSGETVAAAMGVARDDGVPPVSGPQLPLLLNLLDQVALALDRARLDAEARRAATLRERDKIRTALLSSIGEDVKPGLRAIAASTRALRRAPGADKPVLAGIADEVAKLDRYIDNLVDVSPGADREPIEIGPIAIDLFRRSVRRDGEAVHLTPKEFALLAELAKHGGEVLTHTHLLRAVWGPAQQEQIDYLRVAMRALRQKLEADPARPVLLINAPGVGYQLRRGEAG